MLHHIRRSVLDKLATADHLRYGQLKPEELDGNVFNYHLKGLLAERYVLKDADGNYQLTATGRDYIVHRYEDPATSAHSMYLIVLRRGSEYLLRRRNVQPLLGYAGFVHGEPEAGVDIIQSAGSRLHDKTGIRAVSLAVVASAMITQYIGTELQSFSHSVIISGQTEEDIAVPDDATGHNFWSDDLSSVDKLLLSCIDIVSQIADRRPWFECSYTLD